MESNQIGRRLGLFALGWLLSYLPLGDLYLTCAVAAPIKLKLPQPPHRGIAGNRAAAASRDRCPQVVQPLTAIVPEYPASKNNNGDLTNQVWGLTGMERPTFWFYIPYAKTEIANISFTLQDESNPTATQIIYQNHQIPLASTPGMIAIALPNSIAPLATSKPYHWFLKLSMGCRRGQRPIFVDGWVQRQDLDRRLLDRLEAADPTHRVELYAENSLWYDALTALATLRSAQPQDPVLLSEWQNLLESIGLGNIANQPIRTATRVPQLPQRDTGF